ncbi:chitinase-like protein 3 [Diachasmimorpha longicaudata]|uniref:chitinase-like protein 3 n=1 Tax=Diachasmimorpha longicaudata TaxID=58733 RepID=UPI0030B89326
MHLLWFFVSCLALTAVSAAPEKVVYCYFGSWAVYRPGKGEFQIENINPSLCTHLVYTFVGLEGVNVKVLDPWQDLPDQAGKDGFRRFNAIRMKNPWLQTLVAMGGWNEGSVQYSEMAANPESRKKFTENVIKFLQKHGFSGFDLDWEYPAQRGGIPEDRKNYVELLKLMRSRFDEEGFLLSAAVAASASSAWKSFDIPEISKYLDFINIMAYDFHVPKNGVTGLNAPFRASPSDTPQDKALTVEATVKYWLDQGAPKEKLVLGMPLYGRSFTLSNPLVNGVGAPIRGTGISGPYTREPGVLAYNEICEMQSQGGWNVIFDADHLVPYAIRGNQWVSYDNVESIREKAKLVKELGLAGAMVWSVESDDFRGVCGEPYPLLKTINAVLRGGKPGPEEQTPPEKPTLPPVSKHCTKEGNIPNPASCGFIVCIADAFGGFTEHYVECAPGLCFNPTANACDWKL